MLKKQISRKTERCKDKMMEKTKIGKRQNESETER